MNDDPEFRAKVVTQPVRYIVPLVSIAAFRSTSEDPVVKAVDRLIRRLG